MKKIGITAVVTLTEVSESLAPLTTKRPIAALPFASRYRLIDVLLSSLAAARVKSLGLFIGNSGRSIYDHVRSGAAWGLDNPINGGVFTYSQLFYKYQQDILEGFSDDYYEDLQSFIKGANTAHVLVAGSNVLAPIDIRSLRDQLVAQKAQVLNLLSPQGTKMNYYLLSTDLLLQLIDRAIEDEIFMSATELVRYYLPELQVLEVVHQGYLRFINSLPAYLEANLDLNQDQSFQALFQGDFPIITKEKNGAPTMYRKGSKVAHSLIASDCVIDGSVHDSVVFRRVIIESGAQVESSLVMQGSKIGSGAKVVHAIIEKGVEVPAGIELVGTPQAPLVVTKHSDLLCKQEVQV